MEPSEFRLHALGYCFTFSASETSGHRTIERNKLVGGVPTSAHLFGLAVDVVYDGARPGPEADAYLTARGLRRIIESDHDHLQPAEWRA